MARWQIRMSAGFFVPSSKNACLVPLLSIIFNDVVKNI
jgi:hypothetical protein